MDVECKLLIQVCLIIGLCPHFDHLTLVVQTGSKVCILLSHFHYLKRLDILPVKTPQHFIHILDFPIVGLLLDFPVEIELFASHIRLVYAGMVD